jgi:hypothetical protein
MDALLQVKQYEHGVKHFQHGIKPDVFTSSYTKHGCALEDSKLSRGHKLLPFLLSQEIQFLRF